MSEYSVSEYLRNYLETIHRFNPNDRIIIDNIIFKDNNYGSIDKAMSIEEDKKKISKDFFENASAQEPLPYFRHIDGYSKLFLLLYSLGPEKYMNDYVPKIRKNEEHLNSLKKLYNYKEFMRIMFGLLNPTNKYSCGYDSYHSFSNEYKYLFYYIIDEFLKYHNIVNVLDVIPYGSCNNDLFDNLSVNKFNSMIKIINENKNKSLLNNLLVEFTNLN